MAGVTFYGVLWLIGGNDLIARFFDVQLYWTTWFGRVTLILGPIAVYIVTKRVCLGLQRKDRELLEHGVETGIIRQLPTGEFIEVTRPADEDARAVIAEQGAGARAAASGSGGRGKPRARPRDAARHGQGQVAAEARLQRGNPARRSCGQRPRRRAPGTSRPRGVGQAAQGFTGLK